MKTKKCPHCAEEIKSEAVYCKHCKESLVESKTNNQAVHGNLSGMDDLTTNQLLVFQMEANKARKSMGITYLLFLFLGNIGVHQFYLGKSRGAVNAVLLLLFLATVSDPDLFGFAAVVIVGLGVIHIYDLFTIPGQVRIANSKHEEAILSKIKRK